MTLTVPENGETINSPDYELASTNENHTIDNQSVISEELCPMNAYLRDKLESFDHSKLEERGSKHCLKCWSLPTGVKSLTWSGDVSENDVLYLIYR